MSVLVWDEMGKKTYETGVKKGVLYVQNSDGSYEKGVAWNGLISVTESPSGAEATPLYADDIKYLELLLLQKRTEKFLEIWLLLGFILHTQTTIMQNII